MFPLRVSPQLHHDQFGIGEVRSLSDVKPHEGREGENDGRHPRNWQRQGWTLGLAIALGISGAIASSREGVLAQITTDGTLSPAQTLLKNGQVYAISPTFGQTVGSNLFHSFSLFNLNQNEIADFQSGSGIKNILARVTGGSPSLINGEIFTSSADVNLFFINPYGIIFGPNASLDVGGRTGRGAFVATTVDALVWPNGSQFSATNPGGPSSLLTIVGDPGGFLTSSRTPGPISNLGGTLEVYDNQRLILLGGNVKLDGGELKATGGQVEIGAVGGAGKVDLNLGSTGKALGFPDELVRADVLLTNGAQINATTGQNNGTGTGLIRILGRNISLTNGTQLDTSTYGQGNSGGIVAFNATDSLLITGQNTTVFSQVVSGAQGNAGGIGIKAKLFYLTDGAQLTTSTFGQGSSGVVLVQADQVLLDNSQIFSTVEAGGEGSGGGIRIETGSLSLTNGAQLQTLVRGPKISDDGTVRPGGVGDAGVILVRATDSVSLTGAGSAMLSTIESGATSPSSNNQFAGGIFDALFGNSDQKIVGSILISTGSLSLNDNAQINTSTAGRGNAGAVLVLAKDKVSLSNGGAILSAVAQSGEGSAGGILMGVRSLSIDGTSGVPTGLTTETNGKGNAGLILVAADRDVSVQGKGSGIFSTIEQGAVGDSGGIRVDARDLFIKDGAEVSVSNNNLTSGTAGDIEINVRDLRLENEGLLTAVTKSGNGGNINIQANGLLVLTRNSNISTTAGTADAGGNGGNITIDPLYVFAAPVRNSNITAQAYTGNGGSIFIEASKFYSIDNRPEVPQTNDISASSRYGTNGQVTTNVLNVDPTQGLNNLPEAPIDVSRLITQRCAVRGKDSEEVNKFTVTGRGGLPLNPNDTLQNESGEPSWVTPDLPRENRNEDDSSTHRDGRFAHRRRHDTVSSTSRVPQTPVLIEAQGWVYGEKGEIILTAQSPTATPRNPLVMPTASCNAN